MVEGENTGIAAEVCDVLEVQSGPSGHGCERAHLLSEEVTFTRQNWAEQEKWRMSVPLPFLDRFFKSRVEGSPSFGSLQAALSCWLLRDPGLWLSISPSFLAMAPHCRKALVAESPHPEPVWTGENLGSPTRRARWSGNSHFLTA